MIKTAKKSGTGKKRARKVHAEEEESSTDEEEELRERKQANEDSLCGACKKSTDWDVVGKNYNYFLHSILKSSLSFPCVSILLTVR